MQEPQGARRKPRARSLARDAELLEAWCSGDESAGGELLRRHYTSLERFFGRRVQGERAADLVQETIIACIESRHRIQDGERVGAYLQTIARRVYYRHLRRTGELERREQMISDVDGIVMSDSEDNPCSVLARAREQQIMLEGMQRISPRYRIVLELHYWEQLSTKEIAAALGAPSGTIRSRLQRARGALEASMTRTRPSSTN